MNYRITLLLLLAIQVLPLRAFRFIFENATPFDSLFHTKWTAPSCVDEDIMIPAGQSNVKDTSCSLAQVSVSLQEPLGQSATGSGSLIINEIRVASHTRVIPDNALIKVSGPLNVKPPDANYVVTVTELKK